MIDKKFVIVNGDIREEIPDSLNEAFNSTSERIYIRKMPHPFLKISINKLKALSKEVEAVQIEFDQYKNGYNVELKIYLFSKQHSNSITQFDYIDSPCSIAFSEQTYLKFVKQLRKKAIVGFTQ
jgi:hypothetical protein